MLFPDPDTGYYDPDEALEAAHEAEEERYQAEILASHSPQCESDLEEAIRRPMVAASDLFRELAFSLARAQATAIRLADKKEVA